MKHRSTSWPLSWSSLWTICFADVPSPPFGTRPPLPCPTCVPSFVRGGLHPVLPPLPLQLLPPLALWEGKVWPLEKSDVATGVWPGLQLMSCSSWHRLIFHVDAGCCNKRQDPFVRHPDTSSKYFTIESRLHDRHPSRHILNHTIPGRSERSEAHLDCSASYLDWSASMRFFLFSERGSAPQQRSEAAAGQRWQRNERHERLEKRDGGLPSCDSRFVRISRLFFITEGLVRVVRCVRLWFLTYLV